MSITITFRNIERIVAQVEAAERATAPAAADSQRGFFASYGGAAAIVEAFREATRLPPLVLSPAIQNLIRGEATVFRDLAAQVVRTNELLTASAREINDTTSAVTRMLAEESRSIQDVVQNIATIVSAKHALIAGPGIVGAAATLAGRDFSFEHLWRDIPAAVGPGMSAAEPIYHPRPAKRVRAGVRFAVEAYAQVGDIYVGDIAGRDLFKTEHYHLTEEAGVRVEVCLVLGEQQMVLAEGTMPRAYLPERGVELDHSVLFELSLKVSRAALPRTLWVLGRRLCARDGGYCFVIEVQAL